MAETNEPAAERDADFFPLNDLPNDVLVSVFEAAEDPTWVRHTFPLVCKAWNELYRTMDASPLHETLEVLISGRLEREQAPVDASRVISWAQGRAGSVRKLLLKKGVLEDNLEHFSAEDVGTLFAVVGPSLTDFSIGPAVGPSLIYFSIGPAVGERCGRPLWQALRDSVVPAGRLRSFAVRGVSENSFGPDVKPLLGQLAGSLEEVVLEFEGVNGGPLPRFLEAFLALKKLRRLALYNHDRITEIPAEISSLKRLEVLDLRGCNLSSLPKELGELSGLTRLELSRNRRLGTTLPADEAFPAELGNMKCLRELDLSLCRLRTVPSFVGELKSLESLTLAYCDLSSLHKELGELSRLTSLTLGNNWNLGTALPADEAFPAELGKMKSLRDLDLRICGPRTVPSFVGKLESLEVLNLDLNSKLQIDAPLDFLIEGCPRLREVRLSKRPGRDPWTPRSLALIEAFKAKLRAKNPDAEVHTSHVW